MKKNTVKKLFVEVKVDVIPFEEMDVLTASQPEGAYGKLEEWGGLYDIW